MIENVSNHHLASYQFTSWRLLTNFACGQVVPIDGWKGWLRIAQLNCQVFSVFRILGTATHTCSRNMFQRNMTQTAKKHVNVKKSHLELISHPIFHWTRLLNWWDFRKSKYIQKKQNLLDSYPCHMYPFVPPSQSKLVRKRCCVLIGETQGGVGRFDLKQTIRFHLLFAQEKTLLVGSNHVNRKNVYTLRNRKWPLKLSFSWLVSMGWCTKSLPWKRWLFIVKRYTWFSIAMLCIYIYFATEGYFWGVCAGLLML